MRKKPGFEKNHQDKESIWSAWETCNHMVDYNKITLLGVMVEIFALTNKSSLPTRKLCWKRF